MRYFNFFLFIVFMSGFLNFNLDLSALDANSASSTVRAAIDFGSGAVKIQVSVVDTQKNQIVGKPLLAKYIPLTLTECVAINDGYISKEIAQKALSILQSFKAEAIQNAEKAGYDSIQFSGIATAVFRKANNGNEILQFLEQQVGIRFQILSQADEGELGFLNAIALFPEVSKNSLLSWDSGNGSFQMAAQEGDNYVVYKGPIGHGTVRIILSKEIRKGAVLQINQSGNPVSVEEAQNLTKKIKDLLPPTHEWLQKRFNSDQTVIATFGDGESIFALTAQAIQTIYGIKTPIEKATIFFSDVQKVIDRFLGQEDEWFNAEGLNYKTLTSVLHLSAIMQHFGIEQIQYRRSIGNTPGMLLAPQFWDASSCFNITDPNIN